MVARNVFSPSAETLPKGLNHSLTEVKLMYVMAASMWFLSVFEP